MGNIKTFFYRYPEIKPKSSFYRRLRYRNKVIEKLEYANDEDVKALSLDKKTAEFRNILFKSYWDGLNPFIDKFFVLLSRDKEKALNAFALFLYEVAGYDINTCYHVVEEATAIRGMAKSFGLHRIPKFFINNLFLRTSYGFNYGRINYGIMLRQKIKPLIETIGEISKYIKQKADFDLAFYELRIKAPFDVYEKLSQYGLDENHIFELHDLVGIRLVFMEKEREKQMCILEDALIKYIQKNPALFIDTDPATTDNSIKEYYLKPKDNGYNRLHIICKFLSEEKSLFIPVELQVDTHENYGRLENSIETIHGIQKYLMQHLEVIKKGTVNINIEIKINDLGRRLRARHEIRCFRDERVVRNCLREFLLHYFDNAKSEMIIEQCINAVIKTEKPDIKVIKQNNAFVVVVE